MSEILLIPLAACAAMLALVVLRGHRNPAATMKAARPAVPRNYGRLIYGSTALTVVGIVPLSGALGPAAAVKVGGAVLAGLGIAGVAMAAIAMTLAVRR